MENDSEFFNPAGENSDYRAWETIMSKDRHDNMKGARYFCLSADTLFIDWELVLTQVIQGAVEEDIDLRVQSCIFIAHSIRYLDGIGFWVSRIPIRSLHYVE